MKTKLRPIFLILFIISYSLAAQNPVGIPGNWNLIFSDEFNGTSLDFSKWQPNWFGSTTTTITKPVNGAEDACIDPATTVVSGGELVITPIANPYTLGGKTYQYRSGLISSNGKFSFTYGTFEARMWLAGIGTIDNWPAFWADGQNWPQDGEIDVMEGLGGKACYHFHYTGGGPGGCSNGKYDGAWHIFSADWEPGSITYYYDGTPVGKITTGVTSSPLYLIVNLGLSVSVSSPVIIPSSMKVDYVRVWKPTTTNINGYINKKTISVYPNPANDNTTVSYSLTENSNVKIIVCDLLGQEIMQVVNEKQNSGEHHLDIYTEQLKNGIYFIKINVNTEDAVQKLVIQ